MLSQQGFVFQNAAKPDHGQVHLAQTAGGNKILQLQSAMSAYFFVFW